MTELKKCFVIAPIGEPESQTRKRSDKVLKHIIRPSIAECGYYATRADEISEPGLITSQVIQRIVEDPLVIADLTEWNPNVFYELAVRHALRKPFVQLIEKGQRIPFDVATLRTVQFDHTDLDSVETARSEIIAHIKHIESNENQIESPISTSMDLQSLRASGRPVERSLADLHAAVFELSAKSSYMMSILSSIENVLSQNVYSPTLFGSSVVRQGSLGSFGALYAGGFGGGPGSVTPRYNIFAVGPEGTVIPLGSSANPLVVEGSGFQLGKEPITASKPPEPEEQK